MFVQRLLHLKNITSKPVCDSDTRPAEMTPYVGASLMGVSVTVESWPYSTGRGFKMKFGILLRAGNACHGHGRGRNRPPLTLTGSCGVPVEGFQLVRSLVSENLNSDQARLCAQLWCLQHGRLLDIMKTYCTSYSGTGTIDHAVTGNHRMMAITWCDTNVWLPSYTTITQTSTIALWLRPWNVSREHGCCL